MKTALITGTSKGLGFGLLETFLKNNWLVYALARDVSSFLKLHDRYSKTCIPIEGDITEDIISERIAKKIKSNSNSLDVLINNAGNAEKLFGIDYVSPQDLDNHFRVHVSGTFRVIKSCIPFLIKAEKPIIVNISSRKGSIHKINSGTYRILFPYQIAKAGQNMLTACLNQELKDTKIITYAVHPGNLKTGVAPADADTEPLVAANKLYHWVISEKKSTKSDFYSIMDDKILEW